MSWEKFTTPQPRRKATGNAYVDAHGNQRKRPIRLPHEAICQYYIEHGGTLVGIAKVFNTSWQAVLRTLKKAGIYRTNPTPIVRSPTFDQAVRDFYSANPTTLRRMAVKFGVSHETIRKILQDKSHSVESPPD